jgi:hypothetical protein
MSNDEKIIFLEQKVKTLQMYYSAALADSTLRYGKEGILDKITEQKRIEQVNNGSALAQMYSVKEPKQAFEKVQDMFGCADWVCEDIENGFTAVSKKCMLCVLSKKMGTYSPCQIYCLSPIEAMIKGVCPNAEFIIEKTLWDNDKCIVKVKLK